jgi:hypothetical protein
MMTQEKFDALLAEERRLWKILQDVREKHALATDAWHEVWMQLDKEHKLREARAEIEKEMAASQADKPCNCAAK